MRLLVDVVCSDPSCPGVAAPGTSLPANTIGAAAGTWQAPPQRGPGAGVGVAASGRPGAGAGAGLGRFVEGLAVAVVEAPAPPLRRHVEPGEPIVRVGEAARGP